jgi:hypothetical protein
VAVLAVVDEVDADRLLAGDEVDDGRLEGLLVALLVAAIALRSLAVQRDEVLRTSGPVPETSSGALYPVTATGGKR